LTTNKEITKEEIPQEIENPPQTSTRRVANHLGVRFSWTRRTEAYIANDGRHFEQLV
jgi:hypothetical protein